MCQSFWTSSGCCSVASSKILLSGLSVTMSVPKSYDSQWRMFVSSFLCSLGHDFSRSSRPSPNSWQERFWLRLLGALQALTKIATEIAYRHPRPISYVHSIPQYVWDWVQCRYVFYRSARHSRAKFVNCMYVGTAAPFLGSLTSNLLEAPIVLVISNASTNACERSWPILLEALTWNPWQRIFPIRVSGSRSAVDMFANQWLTSLIFAEGHPTSCDSSSATGICEWLL